MRTVLCSGLLAVTLASACGNGDAEAAQRRAAEAARQEQERERAAAAVARREEEAAADLRREQEAAAARARAEVHAPPGVTAVQVTWTVDRSSGLEALPAGTTCSFPIAHFEASFRRDAQCRAIVTCSRVRLYGALRSQGFFACPTFTESPGAVVGEDTSTFDDDGDPTFAIDTRSHRISLHDDARGPLGAFRISGTITAVERIEPPPATYEAAEEAPHGFGEGYGS